jgi:uncharacterized protein
MRFEWDASKDASNRKKHGVSFEEARSVFADADGLLIADPSHSSDVEERFLLLGMSWRLRVLVVVHCERSEEGGDLTLRIISARKATGNETGQYQRRRS